MAAGEMKPYVPPEKSLPEITIKAIILGIILAIVLGAANVYLGLYAGMTISASIPAAVISMAILRGGKLRANILENNIVQTAASSGEALAAGVIFTIPALVLMGYWTGFPYAIVTIIAALGGSLGTLYTIITRRAFIVEERLPYPEGTACADVLIAGDKGGVYAAPILYGGILGAVYKFFTGRAWAGSLEVAKFIGGSLAFFGSDLSVALGAVGYIVGLNIAILVFIGGAIAWFILIPAYIAHQGLENVINTYGTSNPIDLAYSVWSAKIRLVGAGTMLVGGLWSIIKLRKPIASGIRGGIRAAKMRAAGEEVLRTEHDMPMTYTLGLTIAFIVPLAVFYWYILDKYVGITGGVSIGSTIVAAVIMILVGFLASSIAAYLAGIVGSSNNPVSGITIMTLIITALLLKYAVGLRGIEGAAATILVAAVICSAAAIAGDVMQDLATGHIVGATPWKQQAMEIVGTFAAAFVMAPVLNMLHKAYVIGSKELPAPQANLMASISKGIFEGTLDMNMFVIGIIIAIIFIVLDEILAAKKARFRTPVMPVAVGIYLPIGLAVPILIGGIVKYIVEKKKKVVSEVDPGVISAAGLIAGEALAGIVIAGLVVSAISSNWIFLTGVIIAVIFLVIFAIRKAQMPAVMTLIFLVLGGLAYAATRAGVAYVPEVLGFITMLAALYFVYNLGLKYKIEES
ncbi:MAG: oligopeptide transporter, OPT family [Thermoplasmata archaeon]|nr:MAG: oligopeptide transporter, OPT family [Thermoplasmata archaeon]